MTHNFSVLNLEWLPLLSIGWKAIDEIDPRLRNPDSGSPVPVRCVTIGAPENHLLAANQVTQNEYPTNYRELMLLHGLAHSPWRSFGCTAGYDYTTPSEMIRLLRYGGEAEHVRPARPATLAELVCTAPWMKESPYTTIKEQWSEGLVMALGSNVSGRLGKFAYPYLHRLDTGRVRLGVYEDPRGDPEPRVLDSSMQYLTF